MNANFYDMEKLMEACESLLRAKHDPEKCCSICGKKLYDLEQYIAFVCNTTPVFNAK